MNEESGADLESIGVDRHAEGDYVGAIAAYERAHAAYRAAGDTLAAARTARTVGWFRGWIFGDWAVHGGWLARASTLLGQTGLDGLHRGWLLLEHARTGDDLETQRAQYEAVIALAREHGDCDLECDATASLGMMLVFSGHVEEGMRRLDESLAALCSGDVTELPVLEGCLCGLFNACERTHDVRRAEQWLRAADDVISSRNLVAAAGYCRAHYAGILIASGRWTEAEAELLRVIEDLPDGLGIRAAARCRLAGLRVAQGRFEEGAALLAGLDHHEDAVRPLAELHLACGDAELALELLDRALATPTAEDHVVAPLLALSVQSHLALDDREAAAEAAARLTAVTGHGSPPRLRALALLAGGRVDTRDGRVDDLRRAIALLSEAGAVFETARARAELARAVASRRPQVAIAEATAALVVFEELGATPDVDAMAAFLRSLGARTRGGPRGRAELTKREQEVLRLLAHGLTNGQIAARLYISPKTAEHHVGRILSKLGLRSRTEAAVYALRAPNPG